MIDKIRKNTIWLTLSQGISIIVSLILTLILARHLGPRYNGIYNYANAIVGIFAIFVDFGMSTVLIRDIARDTNLVKKYLDNLISLKIIIGTTILGLIVITSFFIKQYSDITFIMFFLGLYNILSGFYSLFTGVFRSHNVMRYESFNTMIQKILMLILGLISLYYFRSVLYYSISFFISTLIGVIISIIIIRKKFIKFSFSINKDFWKYMVNEMWPFGISAIAVTIYFTVDQILLGSLKPITQVGYYALARSATGVVGSIIGIVIGVLFPSLSLLYKKNKSEFENLFNNSTKFMSILAAIFMAEMIVNSKEYVLLIFGYRYYNSITPLILLSIATGIIFINALIGNTFGAVDMQKTLLKGLLIAMVVNIVSNLLLIPKFGVNGSAFSSILTELFISIYTYPILKSKFDIYILKYISIPILAALISGGLMLLLIKFNVILISLIGLATYIILLILFKFISIEFIKDTIKLGRVKT